MFYRLVASLCLLATAFAKTPRPLADIPIRTPDLKRINIKQYRGKVVVLVMISTSCGDCVKTVEIMSKIQKDYGARGLQVVGAAFDDNAAYMIQPYTARYRPGFPIGFLQREDAIKLADMPKDMRPFVPIAMFIDGKGTVRLQYYGDDPIFKQEEKAFRAIVDSLLKFNKEQSAAKQ